MKNFAALLFSLFSFCLTSFGQTTSSFTSSGTLSWTCPAGVTSVKVRCWGGGGAGGGVKSNGTHGGAGGAGGAFAEDDNVSVTPGTTYTVTVGKGGTGSKGDGDNGGDSWFKSTSTVLATGGQGGKGDDGDPGTGSSSGCHGTTIHKGGSGQNGYYYFGTAGGGAGSNGDGDDGSTWNFSGGSGASIGGGDGGDGIWSAGNGLDGSAAGGGGSGAYTTSKSNYKGGNGADGRVDIVYECVNYSLSGISTSSVCRGSAATITLSSTAAGLPTGTYTVTYDLSGANSGTGNIATMTVTTAGSGTFSTVTLSSSGSTTITITNLSMGSCSSGISTNNNATFTVGSNLSGLNYHHHSATYCTGAAITENTVLSISGTGTITYSVSPSLPTGLSINSATGTISGTPTSATSATDYTVTASNGCSSTTKTLSIMVTAGLSGLTYTSPGPLTYCTAGVANNTVASITGSGTITYSVSPSLPLGLTLNSSSGAITGTPLVTKSARDYTITASNSCGSTSTTLNIATAVAPSITASISGAVCIGSTITLQASTVDGATYLWTGPRSFSSNLQSPTLKYVPPAAGTYTVVATSSTGCVSAATTTILAPVAGKWTGNSGSNWDGTGNWCDGTLPSISSDITIPASATSMPVVTGDISVNNLTIENGATLRVDAGGTLKIAGNISNNGLFVDTAGTIEMTGLSAQTIPANTFFNNAVHNLVINNSSTSGVTLGGALDIYNSLTFGGTGMKLNTNDNLTIKSTATGTGSVGDMTGNSIVGKVTVERYLQAKKGWRLLAVPTNTTQTIKEAWQEGCGTSANCTSGYGTQITGPAGTAGGFDAMTGTPSMKTFNSSTGTYVGVPTTNTTNIATQGGYMIFVRGDRSITSYSAPADETVLRSKGPIYTGTQLPINVAASKFAVIGNPYPSALDMRNITKTGMKDFFYVWDPLLSGTYGYGGFQTFSSDGSGNYIVIPGGGSYGPTGSISNYIQSGQAFFMQASTSGGSVTLKESAKTSGSSLVNAPVGLPSPRLMVSLHGTSGGKDYVADGFIVDYGDQFSNSVDDMDAIKSSNSSENVSDKRGNALLVVERRQPINNADTININMTGVSQPNYSFVIDATGLTQPTLSGYLLDNYTGSKTPLQLGGTTTVNFSITGDATSRAANRFQIVFSNTTGTLPVTFNGVSATKDGNAVKVLWDVASEINIKTYAIQRSTNGVNFVTIDIRLPTENNGGSANYSGTDSDAFNGINYYRIMSSDLDGKTAYSKIVKVNMENSANTGITAYPNPITDNMIHLRILYKPAGDYSVRLINDAGKLILRQTISNSGGYLERIIKIPSGASTGIYHLEVVEPGGALHEFNLIK